jgi:hypothetical protein
MTFLPCLIHPIVSPSHNAPIAKAKNFLDLDVGLGRRAEEVLPKLRDGWLPRVHRAVGSWGRVFEDTIVAHEPHHTGDIMTVEGFIERKNGAARRF